MKENTSRTRKTFVNTMFSIASQLLAIVLSFVLRTAFIKILGNQYTGVSSVFTTILTMLSLTELGFGTAIATSLYKPLKENDQETIRKLMDFYRIAYRFVALAVFVIGVILIPFLPNLIKDVPDIKENIVVIYFFYIVKTSLSYLMIYKTTLLRADQKLYVVKKLEMACQTARYLIEIVVLFVFREFMTYLVIEVIATVLQNYIITKRAEKEYPYAFDKPKEKLSKEKIKSLFRDVKGLSMYKLSHTVGNSVDTMMISSFINTSTVAIVGNYTLIQSHVQRVLMQFFSAVIPSVGNLAAEKDEKHQKLVFDRLFYISFLLVNFCSTALFVVFNPFIKIWLGDNYLLGMNIAFVIAFDFFLYILLQAVASFRTANGLFVQGQYRPLFTAILNLVLSFFFIQQWGIFGTIFATVIARFATQWYDPYLLFKLVFHEPFAKFYLKYWIYIAMFVGSCFLSWQVSAAVMQFGGFANFLISLAVALVVPNAFVLLLTCRTKEFKYTMRLIKGAFKKLRRKKAKA